MKSISQPKRGGARGFCPVQTLTDLYLAPSVSTQAYSANPSEAELDIVAGSYLRLTDFVIHLTLGLRAIQKKKTLRASE